MRMPVMSGAAFLNQARRISPNAVRLLLTGYSDVDAAIRAVNDGQLFRFLTKPCPPDELLRACAAALGQHRLLVAEHVLLAQTLRGAIKALTDVLALTNPAAFGRGTRLKTGVGLLAQQIGMSDAWEVEIAALLLQLGAVTLPDATAEKLYSGAALSPEEQKMVAGVPTRDRADHRPHPAHGGRACRCSRTSAGASTPTTTAVRRSADACCASSATTTSSSRAAPRGPRPSTPCTRAAAPTTRSCSRTTRGRWGSARGRGRHRRAHRVAARRA